MKAALIGYIVVGCIAFVPSYLLSLLVFGPIIGIAPSALIAGVVGSLTMMLWRPALALLSYGLFRLMM